MPIFNFNFNLLHACLHAILCSLVSYIGSSLQACTAMSPDKQLNILKDMWRKEKNVEIVISKEDNETIAYYLDEVR